jgi:hypothetical protein
MFDTHAQQKLFFAEVAAEIAKHPPGVPSVFSAEELVSLPDPIENFLHQARWVGKAKPYNARIRWDDVAFRRSPSAQWMKLECHQFNSVAAPARFAYMRAKLLGVVPFEGLDETHDGHGSMRLALASFAAGDERGREMDTSSLVTFLAEALLVPSVAVQEYIEWEAIDARSAAATLTFGDTSVRGVFHFDERGLCSRFVTEDRYISEGKGQYTRRRWIAECSQYVEMGGVLVPSHMRASWRLPDGDLEYFHGNIVDVEYDIEAFGAT